MRTKPVIVYAALALALLLAGVELRALGQLRQRGLHAHRQLLAMRFGELPSQYDALAQTTTIARRLLPWFGQVQAGVEEQRAETRYWQHDYGALRPTRDAGGAIVERNPEILLIAVNAAYRRIQLDSTDRDRVDRLQAVIGQYAEVIKREPELLDAAYNYEFTARLRDRLTQLRGRAPHGLPRPSAQTIHGRPGAPPVRTDMGQFKMVIPQRPDERTTAPQSGTSGQKARKG